MRRLDELLTAASNRGDRMGSDLLIEHLERRLSGEREVTVAASTRRGEMIATKERPTTTGEIPQQPRIRWAIALAGFAVAVVAVVGAAILFGGSDSDVAAPETPDEVMALLATSAEETDADLGILSFDALPAFETRFLEWNLALGMEPVLSNCTAAGSTITLVNCDVTMGRDYFFSVVLGDNLPTTVSMSVRDGKISVGGWPAPDGLADVERDMRAWIQETHPELETQMFGTDYAGIVKFDRTAGELHTQYLDEYLAYREANS